MTRKFQLGVAAVLCFVGIVYLAAVEPTSSNFDLRTGAMLLVFVVRYLLFCLPSASICWATPTDFMFGPLNLHRPWRRCPR